MTVFMDLSQDFDGIICNLLIAKFHAFGKSENAVTFVYSRCEIK